MKNMCNQKFMMYNLFIFSHRVCYLLSYMKKNNALTISLAILAAVALGFILDVAQTVVLPFVISMILVFVLEPVVRALTKIRIPRVVAALIVILIIFGFIFLISLFLVNSIQSFVREYPDYIKKFQAIFSDFNSKYLKRLNIPDNFVQNIDWADAVKQSIVTWSGSFFRFLGIVLLIILFLFFLFLENPLFKRKLKTAYPLHTSRRIGIILEHITRQVSRYLGVKFMVSTGTGILIYIALSIIGMDFALIWAAMAFFFNFIPNIGSIISALLTITVSIIQFYPSTGMIIAVAVSVIVIQVGMGSLLDPMLQGERLNLSLPIILFSLLLWGWLWGIVGAIIAIPITATLRIVFMNIPTLNSVGILMGGKSKAIQRRRKLKNVR